jgi:hypothetical protein
VNDVVSRTGRQASRTPHYGGVAAVVTSDGNSASLRFVEGVGNGASQGNAKQI